MRGKIPGKSLTTKATYEKGGGRGRKEEEQIKSRITTDAQGGGGGRERVCGRAW